MTTVPPLPPPPSLFRSFWLAGFESACHINRHGQRLDMIAAVQHDAQVEDDYARVRALDMLTVRDGVRWPLIDRAGAYDFSSLLPMVRAARRQGIQVIWNLCHYGWPDDLDVFAPAFIERFARFAGAVARVIRDETDEIPFYSPINEISFLAWAAGDMAIIAPFGRGRGVELKRQLARAAIAAMEAVWAVDGRARFAHVDPVIHVVAPRDRPDLAAAAAAQRASQFEAWDMLAGRRDRDLGGAPKYLDIVGVNFYHANEWEHPDNRLRWEDTPRDDRWLPFHRLLAEVEQRYQRPIFIAETSHFGVGRGPWLREMGEEVCAARRAGVPVEGVCLYPILDRTDWEDDSHWHNSGLWDLERQPDGTLRRVVHAAYAAEVRRAQAKLAELGCGVAPAVAAD